MGCVHIYCGDGKGKTTAAVGLAVRMAGSGCRAIIARFLKSDDSGEVGILQKIPGIFVFPCEKTFGFTWQMTEAQKREAAAYYEALFHKAAQAAEEAAEEAEEATGKTAEEAGGGAAPKILLVLDEICAAIGAGLLQEDAVLDFLDRRPENLEVALTGREPSNALLERADYISRIEKLKHPFDGGLEARKGIEY